MSLKSDARKSAQETLDAVWADEGYPVDPIAIARRLGVEVWTAELPSDIYGILRKEQDAAAEIYIASSDPVVRQRFTCAHEVGHYVRHVDANDGVLAFVERRGPEAARGDDPEEIFANEFAAALLMPEARTKALFQEGFRELEFSQYFRVSLESVKWRLVNLGLMHAV